jgi:flavin reductase (DIM6/NTAB) family NADH-FMN oxidoreductase RutF
VPGDAFDRLMASADPAMAVVTASDGAAADGCLVGFHGQASIHPPRYAVWLSKANRTYRVALGATHLGVHLLADGDLAVARWFGTETGDDVDKFAGRGVTAGPGGVPLLDECAHRFVVRRAVLVDDGGDHACFTGEVVDAATAGPFLPLRLARVADLPAGHDVDERPAPGSAPAR